MARGRFFGPGLSGQGRCLQMRFHPSLVPEIAAGAFWDPAESSGLGTTGYAIPDQAGSGNALAQATVGAQPSHEADNGNTVWEFVATENDHVAVASPAAPLLTTTEDIYLAGWLQMATENSSFMHVMGHGVSAADVRVAFRKRNAATLFEFYLSNDGSTVSSNRFTIADPTDYNFVEAVIRPGQETPADRILTYVNRAPLAVANVGDPPSTLHQTSDPYVLGQGAGGTQDFSGRLGPWYHGVGIPSDAHRDLLQAYHSPKA